MATSTSEQGTNPGPPRFFLTLRFSSDTETPSMIRLLLLLAFGYVAYRVFQESSSPGATVPVASGARPRPRSAAAAARTPRRNG